VAAIFGSLWFVRRMKFISLFPGRPGRLLVGFGVQLPAHVAPEYRARMPGRSLEESARFREPVTDGGDQTLMHTEVAFGGGGGDGRISEIGVKLFGMRVKNFENSWERGYCSWKKSP
jgi:hypothetical protein